MALEQQARVPPLDPERVRATMAETCRERGLLDYMTKMWTQVIEEAEVPAAPAWHDRWGELQLPYLPVEPERYGVELTHGSRLLDVGCLSGYGMYDVYRRRIEAELPIPRMTGLDNDPAACEAGRVLAPLWATAEAGVRFLEGDLSSLPFPAHSFDLLIARCVLAYVDLERGLRELRRVLRPHGLAVIQVHGPRYYCARAAATVRSPARFAYYVRPLVSGAVLAARGHPPRAPRFRETALTARGLIAMARRAGFSPLWAHSTPYRPLAVFRAV